MSASSASSRSLASRRLARPSSHPPCLFSRSRSSSRSRDAARRHASSSACAESCSWRLAISACCFNGLSCRRSSVNTSWSLSTSCSRPPSFRSARCFRRRCLEIPAASSMYCRRSSGRAVSTSSSCPCPTTVCRARPIPVSERSSWMSRRRTCSPPIRYSFSPARKIVRLISISVSGTGMIPEELSMTRWTSAIPRPGRAGEPAKMTSAMAPPRRARGPCSPRTQEMASTRLDFPLPFGPTITLIPGANSSVVFSANDLNPRRVNDRRNMPVEG